MKAMMPNIPWAELGGRDFAKDLILAWLEGTGGSNLKLLETATGLPGNILNTLVRELIRERRVELTERSILRAGKTGD